MFASSFPMGIVPILFSVRTCSMDRLFFLSIRKTTRLKRAEKAPVQQDGSRNFSFSRKQQTICYRKTGILSRTDLKRDFLGADGGAAAQGAALFCKRMHLLGAAPDIICRVHVRLNFRFRHAEGRLGSKGCNEIRIAYVTNPAELSRSIELLGLGIAAYNAKRGV